MKKAIYFILFLVFNSTIAQVSDFKSIDFTIANNTAKLNAGSSLDNLPLLAHNLTNKLDTDAEKFRAIYLWVCNNIKGDATQHNKISKKRKQFQNDSIQYMQWNNQYKKTVFKKLFKNKKTMCTGYAYLIKELCFLANIDCKIINGYGRSTRANIERLELANHSWNAVKINNKWYLCDATWSSGYMSNESTFVHAYNDGYFLTDPVLFAKNHYPIDTKWLLNETLTASNFTIAPIVYSKTFKHKILPVSPKELNVITNKNEAVTFSFKSLKTVANDNVSLILFSGINVIPFNIYDLKNENNLVSFKTKFKYNGFYDVHLKIGKDIVATYTIEVNKS